MMPPFFKGMTFGWGAKRGDYRTQEALDSMLQLKQTGSEWIALSFWTWQDTISSTEITFDYGYTVTDRDLAVAVSNAKANGLKVCLKPVVNSRDNIWRAHIGFPDEASAEPYWEKWFASYRNFILHYAELAQELQCEMLCIGCEMVKTEYREADWRSLIAVIRQHYNGIIVYNANHGSESKIPWLDAVDLIGTSAYYPVGQIPGASVAMMQEEWEKVKEQLKILYNRFHKPIVFIEIGCRSAHGCAMMPWDFNHDELPFDEIEQANFYESALKTFWNEPWFSGFFWWDWSTKLYPLEQAKEHCGFDIYGKHAAEVLTTWYHRERNYR